MAAVLGNFKNDLRAECHAYPYAGANRIRFEGSTFQVSQAEAPP